MSREFFAEYYVQLAGKVVEVTRSQFTKQEQSESIIYWLYQRSLNYNLLTASLFFICVRELGAVNALLAQTENDVHLRYADYLFTSPSVESNSQQKGEYTL